MQFLYLRPILYCSDLSASVEFYQHMLGFTCMERNEDWGWASLQKDMVEIMLARPNAHTPFTKANFTGSLYINVSNVEEAWEKLKNSARICYPIENFEWQMREFAIYDPDGYIIQFGEPVNSPMQFQ